MTVRLPFRLDGKSRSKDENPISEMSYGLCSNCEVNGQLQTDVR